ncbi:hypothetical protein J6590_020316 [Homalodisca vitripennis]|nr:hypothetical protein J6590_020316 [Homalodisca vitripennis]
MDAYAIDKTLVWCWIHFKVVLGVVASDCGLWAVGCWVCQECGSLYLSCRLAPSWPRNPISPPPPPHPVYIHPTDRVCQTLKSILLQALYPSAHHWPGTQGFSLLMQMMASSMPGLEKLKQCQKTGEELELS